MTVRRLRQRRGWAWAIAVPIVKPLLLATTKPHWIDGEKIPAEGGCIVVFNHISEVDPLIAAHIMYDHGRLPRYLAKANLFKNRFLGLLPPRGRARSRSSGSARTPPARSTPPSRRCVAASSWSSTPRARSPATPTCGR